MKKRVLFVVMSLLMMFPLMGAYGYDYDYDPDANFWIVDNYHGSPNHVLLYYMMKPDRYNQYSQSAYGFTCSDAEFKRDDVYAEYLERLKKAHGHYEVPFVFQYQSENKKVVNTFTSPDGTEYEVWLWQFGIENGTYSFSGMDSYHDFTLASDLTYTGKEDWITVDGGDVVHVYTFFENGSYTFPDEDKQMLIKYARTNEFGAGEETTISVEGESSENTPVQIIEETEEKPVLQTTETKEPEKKDIITPLKAGIFFIVCLLCIAWVKGREE